MHFRLIAFLCLFLANPASGFTIQKDQHFVTPVFHHNTYTDPTIYGITSDRANPLGPVIPARKQHFFQVTLPGTAPGIATFAPTTFSFNFIMTGTSHLKYWRYTLDQPWTIGTHSYVNVSRFLVRQISGGLDADGRYLAGSLINFSFTLDGSYTNIYGHDPYFRLAVASAPIPAAGWMLISGMAGLGWLARRRKAAG